MSCAAVAQHMGTCDRAAEAFKELQIVLGLGRSAAMISDVENMKIESCLLRVSSLGSKWCCRLCDVSVPNKTVGSRSPWLKTAVL